MRIASTGIVEVEFDITRNPVFKAAQNAVVAAMRRSVQEGACMDRKKSAVIGVDMEKKVLADVDYSTFHARGCQRRFAFYCVLRFAIRGGSELYKVQREQFSRGCDEIGEYVRFNERLSKNYKVYMAQYQVEHFRPAVSVHDSDVVATFDQMMKHMPAIDAAYPNLCYMFLQPIDNPRTQVWYNRNRVSVKYLSLLVRNMMLHTTRDGNYSNKSLRVTAVTRMSLGQVPPEVGMLVTGGHKQPSSYQKYDCSSNVRVAPLRKILFPVLMIQMEFCGITLMCFKRKLLAIPGMLMVAVVLDLIVVVVVLNVQLDLH